MRVHARARSRVNYDIYVNNMAESNQESSSSEDGDGDNPFWGLVIIYDQGGGPK